jgi:hypothetical protein
MEQFRSTAAEAYNLAYSSTIALTSAIDGGGGVKATPWPLYPRERDPVAIVQEVGWAPGPVQTGAEKLASTGIRSPDRPARRCTECVIPAHKKIIIIGHNIKIHKIKNLGCRYLMNYSKKKKTLIYIKIVSYIYVYIHTYTDNDRVM